MSGSEQYYGPCGILAKFIIDPEQGRGVSIEHLITVETSSSEIRIIDQSVIVLITVTRIKNIDHTFIPLRQICTKKQPINSILYYKLHFVKIMSEQ